jgi:hypothetical protein
MLLFKNFVARFFFSRNKPLEVPTRKSWEEEIEKDTSIVKTLKKEVSQKIVFTALTTNHCSKASTKKKGILLSFLKACHCYTCSSISMIEYRESGEDISENTVWILRNWGAIRTDGRRPEVRIGPQFRRMKTVFSDMSEPDSRCSHCY